MGKIILRAFLSAFFVLLSLVPSSAHAIDFIVPGVSLESLSFEEGARVAYLVIDWIYETSDTSLVELGIVEYAEGEVLLEISSSPFPPIEDEKVTLRLLLSDDVRAIQTPEEFYACVGEILVREGRGSFRVPSTEEIEDFSLEKIFLKKRNAMECRSLGKEDVEAPAGRFSCRVSEFFRSDIRTVSLGGVEAERIEEERSVVWLSGRIPIWGLVRSRVESSRSTKVLNGSDQSWTEPRVVVTESILFSYGLPGQR